MHSLQELVLWRVRGTCPTHGHSCHPRREAKALGKAALEAAAQWHVDRTPVQSRSGW